MLGGYLSYFRISNSPRAAIPILQSLMGSYDVNARLDVFTALLESRDIKVLLIVYNSHFPDEYPFQKEIFLGRLYIEIFDPTMTSFKLSIK